MIDSCRLAQTETAQKINFSAQLSKALGLAVQQCFREIPNRAVIVLPFCDSSELKSSGSVVVVPYPLALLFPFRAALSLSYGSVPFLLCMLLARSIGSLFFPQLISQETNSNERKIFTVSNSAKRMDGCGIDSFDNGDDDEDCAEDDSNYGGASF